MGTSGERYAVVSCHVERPLDDRVWAAFSRLQERRPGGLAVAALVRPPDEGAGEDDGLWLERARAAAERGPFGHHTHWTSPTHARPTADAAAGAGDRVLREGVWLRSQGLAPAIFCGGGWYTDASVAAACAELGYVDCTPRPARPHYLSERARWARLREPSCVGSGSGRFLAVPTTHSIGDLARDVWRRRLPERVHVYLHDTDLLDRRRRLALETALALLARRRPPLDLDALARTLPTHVPDVGIEEILHGDAV
jgi:hypothetical protein